MSHLAAAADGNTIEVGAKFFLRNGQLVTITHCSISSGQALIGWQGYHRSRKMNPANYTLEGEYQRYDYDEEHSHDIVALHSYKAAGFSKAIRLLDAKGQQLRA